MAISLRSPVRQRTYVTLQIRCTCMEKSQQQTRVKGERVRDRRERYDKAVSKVTQLHA